MSLKFSEIKLNKKEFHISKQSIYLIKLKEVKFSFLMNSSLMIVLKMSLDTKMMKMLKHYVLFYL